MPTETRIATEKETTCLGQLGAGYDQLQHLKVCLDQLQRNTIKLFGATLLALEVLHPTVQGIVLAPIGYFFYFTFWTPNFTVCV